MTTKASGFVGSIPENYDRGLGPRVFFDRARGESSKLQYALLVFFWP